mgnify:CR=1 FL=1
MRMRRNRGWFKVGHKPWFGGTKHGYFGTPTYTSWAQMNARCANKKSIGWHLYGGRGIKVCERWLDFSNFLADMGEKPEGKTIDRINNDGKYEPNNCRWATRKEQALNRRSTRWLEHNGKRLSLRDWARETGVDESAIYWRLKNGWSVEKSLSRKDFRRG